MTGLEGLAVFGAGIAAGTINTIVGSGTLVTFPVLLAVGYPPVVVNVSNAVGLVPGSASGAYGYRRELSGQGGRLVRLGSASFLGGVTGALLLLVLPAGAFRAIVPSLIALACVLVVVQPSITRRLGERGLAPGGRNGGPLLFTAIYGAGVYGGYFGGAQGVLVFAVLGLGVSDEIQRINAAKNALTGLANLVAGTVFIVVADVAWEPALLIAAGSVGGGQIGATIGRRLPPALLRATVVIVGVMAIGQLLAR